MFNADVIGVVGFGFVGEALYEGMKNSFTVKTFDRFKKSPSSVNSLKELASVAEVIFVCVPTPMKADGSCDTSIVEAVVAELNSFELKNVVVIKSTVPPGTTLRLHEQCTGVKGVVFNPEFLTEANYIKDFKNQNRIILGCIDDEPKSIVKRVYQRAFPSVPTLKTHPTIAEMVKYTTNTFLATKISFANEIKQVCDSMNIDYDKVIEYATFDERLGKTHWAVPGPDGDYGFGLSCFPKDLNALMFKAKELNVKPKIMAAVWDKNLEVRKKRDWEYLAKAVTNFKKKTEND